MLRRLEMDISSFIQEFTIKEIELGNLRPRAKGEGIGMKEHLVE